MRSFERVWEIDEWKEVLEGHGSSFEDGLIRIFKYSFLVEYAFDDKYIYRRIVKEQGTW